MNNDNLHTNKHAASTYTKIISTFKQLVIEKNFEKLSVAEISSACSISRKTFYQYFRDKNDIVDQIFLNEIILPLKQLRSLSSSLEMPALTIMSWMYEQLYNNRIFYIRINYFTGQNSLFDIIIDQTSEMIAETINQLPIPTYVKEYTIYFYAASHSLIIKKWISEGMQVHPKEMAKMYELWTIPNFENMTKESNKN